ncbi:hypothetical protein CPT_Muenster_037 [Klebsiella phage Muenster]|nr:hypothetical protein CPT_Muenster_037 [Klebsiella phage Muenster]
MRIKLTNDEIHSVLTTNMQDWKKYADIEEVQELNDDLSVDEIITICSSQFFDDINDEEQDVFDIMEKHFIAYDVFPYTRQAYILIHNIYNK